MTEREFKMYVEKSKISTFTSGHIHIHWGNFSRINKPDAYYIECHKNGTGYFMMFDEGKMQIIGEYFVIKERRYVDGKETIVRQNIHYKWVKDIRVSLNQRNR